MLPPQTDAFTGLEHQGPPGCVQLSRTSWTPREVLRRPTPGPTGGGHHTPPPATPRLVTALPPAARPHIVDDHGLVSDDVVGLHGPAEPALPSRRAAGGPAGYKARGEIWTDATPDTAPLPSPSALPTRTRPRGQSQVPTDLIDGGRRGGLLGEVGRASWSRLTN